MENVQARLGSLAEWPKENVVSGQRLAEAGFVYTGNGDAVVCFACQGRVEDWIEGDDPLECHAMFYPGCPFLSESFPLTVKHAMQNEQQRVVTFPVDWCPCKYQNSLPFCTGVPCAQELARLGFFYCSQQGAEPGGLCCVHCLTHFKARDSALDSEDIIEQHIYTNHVCPFLLKNHQRYHHLQMLLQTSQLARLATFTSGQNWPALNVDIQRLVSAGLFYTQTLDSDLVQCAFCSGGLQVWEPGDCPWEEAQEAFPELSSHPAACSFDYCHCPSRNLSWSWNAAVFG